MIQIWNLFHVDLIRIIVIINRNMLKIEWSLRVVYDLPLNWYILIFFNFLFLSNILNMFFTNILWNILSKILHSIVINDGHFSWYFFDSNFLFELNYFSCLRDFLNKRAFFILNDFLFKRNVLDFTFSFQNNDLLYKF